MYSKTLDEILEQYEDNDISLEQFFSQLPDEEERIYEIYIGKAIKSDKEIEEKALEILSDNTKPRDIVYSAFYCLCTYYRRYKEYSKYEKLLEDYRFEFKNKSTFPYLESMYQQEYGNLRKAITLSEKAVEKIPENAGILHSYACIFAEAFEENVLNPKEHEDKLDNAIEISEKAIYLNSDYAKFYCTYGRLLAIKGEYEEAKKNINKAIDKEDPTRLDYSLVIGEYQRHLSRVEFKKSFHGFETYKETLEDELTDLKTSTEEYVKEMKSSIQGSFTKNLEFLGFFTALISFTIGALQISTKYPFDDAVRIILVLCGGLLLVLGGFGIVLNGRKGLKRNGAVIVLGMLIVGMSIVSSVLM